MKNFLRHLLSPLLLGSMLFAFPAHADDLTPTQVADLYLKAVLEGNLESAQKLNDYLREGPDGVDVLGLEILKNFRHLAIDSLMKVFMSESGPGAVMPELKPHALEFFAAMQDAIHSARCKAEESIQDGSTATVRVTCVGPNLDPVIHELKALAADHSSADAIKTFLTKAAATYREAPLTKTAEGKLLLQRSPHGKWRCKEEPFDVLSLVIAALQFPF